LRNLEKQLKLATVKLRRSESKLSTRLESQNSSVGSPLKRPKQNEDIVEEESGESNSLNTDPDVESNDSEMPMMNKTLNPKVRKNSL